MNEQLNSFLLIKKMKNKKIQKRTRTTELDDHCYSGKFYEKNAVFFVVFNASLHKTF